MLDEQARQRRNDGIADVARAHVIDQLLLQPARLVAIGEGADRIFVPLVEEDPGNPSQMPPELLELGRRLGVDQALTAAVDGIPHVAAVLRNAAFE